MDTSIQKSKAFISGLKKGLPSNHYLFLGEEESEKERAAVMIRDMFFSGEEGEFSVFHADNGELIQAAGFLLSTSMFSSKKVALIKGMGAHPGKKESGKTGGGQLKETESIIRELCERDDYVVIFSSPSKTPAAVFKKTDIPLTKVIFYPPFENDVASYLSSELRKRGKNLSSDDIHLIASLVGRSYGKADDAVEKIVFGTEGTSPDRKELITLLSETREFTVFEYIDALFTRSRNSFILLKHVLEEGVHELQVLALINRRMKDMERSVSEKEYTELTAVAYKAERELKTGRQNRSFLSNPLVSLTETLIRQKSK